MSNRNKGNDGFNDVDIAALFAADTTEPPSDLDDLVLANAHAPASALAPIVDLEDNEPFLNRYAPLLATTAVLMIAFALTPFTGQAPNRAPQTAGSSQVETMADASIAGDEQTASLGESRSTEQAKLSSERGATQASVRQDNSENTDTAAEQLVQSAIAARSGAEQAESDSDAAGDIDVAEAPAPVSVATESALSSAASSSDALAKASPNALQLSSSDSKPSSASAEAPSNEGVSIQATQTARATTAKARPNTEQNAESASIIVEEKSEQPFRKSPLLWVIEIKRLFGANNVQAARNELSDFREQHPDSTHERLLPAGLQAEPAEPDQQ